MLLPGTSILMTSFQADLVSGLSVSVYPTSVKVFQAFNDGDIHTLTTATVTATATGGSGSYTYATALLSGSTEITATSPTGAATAFTGSLSPEDQFLAVFRITATDTLTLGTAHADVPAELHYVDTR